MDDNGFTQLSPTTYHVKTPEGARALWNHYYGRWPKVEVVSAENTPCLVIVNDFKQLKVIEGRHLKGLTF